MSNTIFDTVWNRVMNYKGETFYTKTGLPFTYEIQGNTFYLAELNMEYQEKILN